MFSVHHFSSMGLRLINGGENDSVTNSLRVKLLWSLGTWRKRGLGIKSTKSIRLLQATEMDLLS